MARNKKSIRWNMDAVPLKDLRRFQSLHFSIAIVVDWVQYQDRIESIPCLLKTLKSRWTLEKHFERDALSQLQRGQCCTVDGPVGSNMIFYLYPKGKSREAPKSPTDPSVCELYANLLRKPWWIKSFKYHFTLRFVTKNMLEYETEGEIKTEGDRWLSFSFAKPNVQLFTGWRSLKLTGTIIDIERN